MGELLGCGEEPGALARVDCVEGLREGIQGDAVLVAPGGGDELGLLLKVRAKYRCQQCKFYFELDKPGPTRCPRCGFIYVDWLNHKEVLVSLGRWKGGE